MRTFKILIGASGSGKSTLCNALPDAYVCSADDFFMVGDEYKFNPAFLGYAHQMCSTKVRRAFEEGLPLVVLDNTNQTVSEITPYVKLAERHGYRVEFVVFRSELDPEVLAARNAHGVPVESIQLQLERIQTLLNQWPAEWPAYEKV